MVFPGYSVSYINKTYRHDITERLLKVALNTINLDNKWNVSNNEDSIGKEGHKWFLKEYIERFLDNKNDALISTNSPPHTPTHKSKTRRKITVWVK